MNILYCCKIRVKLLDIFVASSTKGTVRIGIRWADENTEAIEYFKGLLPRHRLLIDEYYNLPTIAGIKNALSGKEDVKMALDVSFTPFQLKVMNAIKQIPFGKTITYKDVAYMLNKPYAFRAVGQALKKNPIPIIFP